MQERYKNIMVKSRNNSLPAVSPLSTVFFSALLPNERLNRVISKRPNIYNLTVIVQEKQFTLSSQIRLREASKLNLQK